MLSAEARGDNTREASLVVTGRVEANREGLEPERVRVARREGGDRAGVDASTHEDPDRHVADEAAPHRHFELIDQSPTPFALVDGVVGRERQAPVRRDLRLGAGRDYEHVRGGEFRGARQDRVRRGDCVDQQVPREALEIERVRNVGVLEQRSELGAEHEHSRAVVIVERLLAHPVPCQHELPLRPIPERQGEHAVEVGDEVLSVLLVRVDDDFSIRLGPELVSAPLKPRTKLTEVVDLAVEDRVNRSVLVPNRLPPARQVDDAEPT